MIWAIQSFSRAFCVFFFKKHESEMQSVSLENPKSGAETVSSSPENPKSGAQIETASSFNHQNYKLQAIVRCAKAYRLLLSLKSPQRYPDLHRDPLAIDENGDQEKERLLKTLEQREKELVEQRYVSRCFKICSLYHSILQVLAISVLSFCLILIFNE